MCAGMHVLPALLAPTRSQHVCLYPPLKSPLSFSLSHRIMRLKGERSGCPAVKMVAELHTTHALRPTSSAARTFLAMGCVCACRMQTGADGKQEMSWKRQIEYKHTCLRATRNTHSKSHMSKCKASTWQHVTHAVPCCHS